MARVKFAGLGVLLVGLSLPTSSGRAAVDSVALSANQVRSLRAWIVTIVEDQIQRGPNPRWTHRDCAGLVRFAVRESLRSHDDKWRKGNGFLGRPLPPEVELSEEDRKKLSQWQTSESKESDYARAFDLVKKNSQFLGKTIENIEPGDLLFFDQGEDQHVMIWTGRRIVYHNGHRPKAREKITDNGLRAVSLRDLMTWKDTRWQPNIENPNFIGFFRMSVLSPRGQL